MPDYIEEITLWQQTRNSELRDPDGWLTLAGLFWLESGRNSFGSSPANAIHFPHKAASFMGEFVVTDTGVEVVIAPDICVTSADAPVSHLNLTGPEMEGPVLAYGPLRWFVIHRDGRWAVRLRDREHPALAGFQGVGFFPVDPAWRVEARLIPHPTPLTVPVPTILGSVNQTPSPGVLHFSVQGRDHSLIALAQGKSEISLIFADETSGKETYGSGRFLTVPTPDRHGHTTIDFNQAYNPPCAFTPFATCPLPPQATVFLSPSAQAKEKRIVRAFLGRRVCFCPSEPSPEKLGSSAKVAIVLLRTPVTNESLHLW